MKSFLVVDDDCMTLEWAREALRGLGFVLTAKTVAEGLVVFRENPVDLIVIDYELGEETGLELLRQVRIEDKVVPVLLLSGFVDEQKLRGFLAKGGTDVIDKFGSIEEFRAKIEVLLDRKDELVLDVKAICDREEDEYLQTQQEHLEEVGRVSAFALGSIEMRRLKLKNSRAIAIRAAMASGSLRRLSNLRNKPKSLLLGKFS